MPKSLYTPERLLKVLRQRLSLRKPQSDALLIMKDVVENHLDLSKKSDVAAQLEIIAEAYPQVTDFERAFPSLCFALATGVGKTRLMGAFIVYLYLMDKSLHFMVIAPNTTIYQKLITDFTPGTAKYVFQGVSEFVQNQPVIITGDDWEKGEGVTASENTTQPIIHIFNIQKIHLEDGKIRSIRETIGESYFDFLSGLPDLVVLMDEAHRYRAKAGMEAIDDLKPVLGLEVTATPKTTGSGAKAFKNVIYHYPLANALRDGFVKKPSAVTRNDFDPKLLTPEQLQQRKLIDAVYWHKRVKAEIAEYARANKVNRVHPFILVVAQDTSHSSDIKSYIQSDDFYGGAFKDKVIEIHSNLQGEENENAMQRLLALETTTDTEILIHVNKLKEGWDVSNLFTIVPLRASASDILTEQTLGRGLRLPYGKLTGNKIIDALCVVAHDKFKTLIDESQKEGSILMEAIELGDQDNGSLHKPITIPPNLSATLVGKIPTFEGGAVLELHEPPRSDVLFEGQADKRVVCETLRVVRDYAEKHCKGGLADLDDDTVRSEITKQVDDAATAQKNITEEALSKPVGEIVRQCLDEIVSHTIEVPEIIISPSEEVSFEIENFDLEKLGEVNYQPVQDQILARDLLEGQSISIEIDTINSTNINPTERLIELLSDKQEINYDDDADLLTKLVGQMIDRLNAYLADDVKLNNVVVYYGPQLAEFIHIQIIDHQSKPTIDYNAEVKKGFKLLRPQVFSASNDKILPYTQAANPLGDTSKYLFTGFKKCGYPVQKFQSNAERQFAELLEDEGRANIIRWMKPAKNQFNIKYNGGVPYNPDFIIETPDEMIIAEVKNHNEMGNNIVTAKASAAKQWIGFVNQIALKKGKKKWRYLLIPDNAISPSTTLNGLISARTWQAS